MKETQFMHVEQLIQGATGTSRARPGWSHARGSGRVEWREWRGDGPAGLCRGRLAALRPAHGHLWPQRHPSWRIICTGGEHDAWSASPLDRYASRRPLVADICEHREEREPAETALVISRLAVAQPIRSDPASWPTARHWRVGVGGGLVRRGAYS